MEQFLKIYLPVFFLVFTIVVFIIPSVRVKRKTGINPFRFISKDDNAHDFVGASMKTFIFLLLCDIMLYSFSGDLYKYLGPISYLDLRILKIIGLILGHFSLLGIIIAQLQMKLSWRIGIDFENKTPLVQKGLFSVSRNPIYLFLLIALGGLFMILPNALTFAILFAAYLVLQITMRLEEDFLSKQHGEDYNKYKQNVRRLI